MYTHVASLPPPPPPRTHLPRSTGRPSPRPLAIYSMQGAPRGNTTGKYYPLGLSYPLWTPPPPPDIQNKQGPPPGVGGGGTHPGFGYPLQNSRSCGCRLEKRGPDSISSHIVCSCTCTETMALNGYINICILWLEFSNWSPIYILG